MSDARQSDNAIVNPSSVEPPYSRLRCDTGGSLIRLSEMRESKKRTSTERCRRDRREKEAPDRDVK